MSATYEVTSRDRWVGVANAIWIATADAALHVVGRAASCLPAPIDPRAIDPAAITTAIPGECVAQAVAPSVEIMPALHQGALLGLGAPAIAGYPGQLYALAILLLTTLATVLLPRWPNRAGAEPRIIGLLWGCAVSLAWPRFVFGGQGLATMHVAGLPMTVADVVLPVALLWLVARLVSERSA
jgi:hypothetical protein